MMDHKPTFFQRRYLIDKRFQIKYTLMVLALSALIFIPMGYKLYLKEKANTEILKIQNLDLAQMVNTQDLGVLFYLAGFFLLQMVSLFVLGILITHRIAGPVSRVHRYLDEMAQTGEVKALDSVRNRDEFKEFFEALSDVITKFQAKTARQRALAEEIRSGLGSVGTDPAKQAQLLKLADELRAAL